MFSFDFVYPTTQVILRVVELSLTLSPTRNIPLIKQERTLESPDDSLILRDVPSSSAMILHGTPATISNPKVEL